jgi:SSS family solute:Na+ symporter
MSATYVYLALGIYVIIGTIVAVLSSRGMGKGMTEYFLANRGVGGILAALTYSATTYSAFMMVGLAGMTFRGGVGALGFELIYLSGLILVAFFGPRFWLVGKKYDYVTPSEMLGDRYQSKWVAILIAIASCIFLIPYSAVQLMGIGYLMSGVSGGAIPFLTGVLLATVLAVIWAWIAGMRSVAWTDSLQAVVMMFAAVFVAIILVNKALGGFGNMFASLESDYGTWLTVPGPGFFSFKVFLGLSLPWFFFSISNPQVSQRLFIPKSLKSMRTMLIGFLVFGFIYTLVSIIWGYSAKILVPDLANPDMATPTLLAMPEVPTMLALLVMIGITGAAISTVDSIMLTLSSMFSRDIYKNVKEDASDEKQLWIGKLVIPVIALLAFLFARQKIDLIAVLSVASSAGLLVIVPSIVGAFFWKRGTAPAVILSVIIGGLVSLYLQYSGLKPLGHWPGVWSFIVSIVIFIGVSYVTEPPKEKADEFLGYLQTELKNKNVV